MKHHSESGVGWTWTLGPVEVGIGWSDRCWLPFRMPVFVDRLWPEAFVGPTPGTIAIPIGNGRDVYVDWQHKRGERVVAPRRKIA